MNELINLVPKEQFMYTIIVLAVITVGICKYLPMFYKWFNIARIKANDFENVSKTINQNATDIDIINQKIGRDYARLNQIFQIVERQQKYIEDSLEERELILRSLLGIIQGLQEVGANGPTKRAEAEIQAFLLKKSHDVMTEEYHRK